MRNITIHQQHMRVTISIDNYAVVASAVELPRVEEQDIGVIPYFSMQGACW